MDDGRARATTVVMMMAGLGFGTLQAGNVPGKAAWRWAAVPLARGLSRAARPAPPAVLVRRTLDVYGPIQAPGQDDHVFRIHGSVRVLESLDLGPPAGPEPRPEPVDPSLRAHVRAVALAGNFANWVRRALQAFEQEGGTHQAQEELRRQLKEDGELFRMWLEVEITANRTLLRLAAGADHESGLQAANARMEAALERWRTHVVPLMKGLGEEAMAKATAPGDGVEPHGAGFPDEDPRKP